MSEHTTCPACGRSDETDSERFLRVVPPLVEKHSDAVVSFITHAHAALGAARVDVALQTLIECAKEQARALYRQTLN